MFEFDFLIRKQEPVHVHSDVEFFFVMEGTVRFVLEDKTYTLHRGDFLVVNVDKNHSYAADGEFLAASIHISYSELSSMMKQSMIFFWCNTAVEKSEACQDLGRVMQKIIAEQYRNQNKNAIFLNSLYYEFLHILTTDFLLNKENLHYGEETHKFDARKHEIEEFIRLNFDKQISLEDLSKQLFLSYTYLSKYIKRHFGMGFAEYLNTVRLNYAVSQLLHSDLSVVRIAMESGFASSAALNKAFKEKYSMTPTEYRRRWMNKEESSSNTAEEEKRIREHLNRHFNRNQESDRTEKRMHGETAAIQSMQRHVLKKSWNRMINMGTVRDLLQSDMQEHVVQLKQELQFEYVRFWDLYDEELYMNSSENGYNFDKLDRVLDFLLKNDLKPYIELRNKPKRIMQNQTKDLLLRTNPSYTEDLESTEHFLRKFIIHLINRYHTDKLETWYFELWNAEPEEVLLQPSKAKLTMSVGQYLDRFDLVAGVLRDYLPTIRLGGGGFSARYGMDLFQELLAQWKQRENLPDFLTAYVYPYTVDTVEHTRNQSRNADLLQENLHFIRDTIDAENFPTRELHVTEWNFSVSSRNLLNDHCMKGAYLVRNMIDSVDYAEMMGYWVGSDLFAAHHTSSAPVNGSGGLLTKDGIRKPAYYAFDFMNHLGKYVRKKDEHYIITDNGSGNWRIVCHNLKNLNHEYTLRLEDEMRLNELNNLFSDHKKHRIHFDLPARRAGKYLLRIHSINQYYGSVQDEWIAMSSPEELSRDDIKYLGRITTPRMVLQNCVSENGRIAFDITLEPNEIAYIHVTYQYS